ncbi:unnamed protein product [Vicia faba]|uniref:WRKY domain-containing protein n=1 Tax=Vicia faba TaxID=3906 RepID=A0AAV0YLI8_VICFA|nr:unnamed protein product [Vicia faba]
MDATTTNSGESNSSSELPISRSPCVTIPPVLSPTSFLESPVLLSDMKVEPSPTTGSFLQALHCSMASTGSATFSVTSACFNNSAVNGRKSSFFEFKPHDRNMVPADFNNDAREQSTQVEVPALVLPLMSIRMNLTSKATELMDFNPRTMDTIGEMKKLFERSHDGQITEIIYKGTHDHPKPQPNNRYSAGSVMSTQGERSDNRVDKASNSPEQSPVTTIDLSPDGAGFASTRTNDEVDDDDPFSKRRKMELGNAEIIPIVKPIREPRVVVQTMSEVDILDDGYRWRKYGQKVVRGNPNPRSYYKCTNTGCPVRKHVERASHDPKAVITTYEVSIEATRIKLEESDTISLNLGMGINSATENRSNGRRQMLLSEIGNSSQIHTSNSNFKFVHTTSVPVYYGVLNNSSNPFGSSENRNDGSSLNRSAYPCTQNMGRILMGP